MNIHPFNAIGRLDIVFIIGGKRRKSHGTGTLIATNLVITAAHNIYHRDSKTTAEPQNVVFWLPSINENIKVLGIYFPEQYKDYGENDSTFYDYAIIVIEKNNKIMPDVPLEIGWNHKFGKDKDGKDELLYISGYPDYDTSKQYLDQGKKTAQYERTLEYGHSLSKGHSGAPVLA
jgi:V8-like Glu-specific endopeptidase